ncbi:MAG: tetratricopeptide repeat protein [Planctomycetes bacterium]|nr:tetratricopeptide repeat protein [Planctomycetota bacterium]
MPMMRSTFLVLALACCAVVAYFGLLAAPNAAIHLERARQILRERAGDPSALPEARASLDRAITTAQRAGQSDVLRDALLQRGSILHHLGAFEPALRDFQTVIALDPSNEIQTVLEIVNTLINAGRRFEKLEAFDRAFEFLDQAAQATASPVAKQNGNLAAARAQCHAARADARLELLRDILLALNDGNDPSQRVRILEALCADLEEGQSAELLRQKLSGNLSAAEELRRKEILSGAEAVREDRRAALRFLEESVAERPQATNLARLLELATAAGHWERVLDLGALFDHPRGPRILGVGINHPTYEIVPFAHARALRAVGRPLAARRALEAFFEAFPKITAREIFLEHIDLLAELGEGARVLELIELVRAEPQQIRNPRVARVLPFYEGLGYAGVGELERARESLLLFLTQANPRSEPKRLPQALLRLAAICEELGDPEQANRYQERLLPLLENPARVFAELARRAFERQLEYEESSRLLLRAMQDEPPLALEWMPLWRRIGTAFLNRAGVDLEGAASQAIKSTSLRADLFDPSVLFLAAEHLVDTERALEALPMLLNLSQLAPRLAPGQRLRAKAWALLGHHGRAMKAYQEYLTLVPGDAAAWLELETLLSTANEDASEAELRALRFRALRATLPERGALEISRRLIANGEIERALEIARTAQISEEQRAELAVLLARAMESSRPAEALALLDELSPDAPAIGAARLLALRLALRSRDSAESQAERIGERVRTLRGTPLLPQEEIAPAVWALIERGHGDEALELLDLVAADSDQRGSQWYRQQSLALVERRDWRRAETALDRALARGDADGVCAAVDLFLLLSSQQRLEEARELVELVRKLPIAGTARFPLWIAVLRALAGDFAGASAELASTRADDHPFGPAALAVQRLARLAGAKDGASKEASSSESGSSAPHWIEALEPNELLLFLEAVLLREVGRRPTKLRAVSEHLLLRHPRSATLQLFLAEAMLDLGEHEKVLPLVQLALALSPELGPALELLQRAVREVGDAEQRWQITAQRLHHLCQPPGGEDSRIAALGEELLALDRPNEVLTALFQLGARAERTPLLLALSARAWSALDQPDRAQRQVREIWLRFDAAGQRDEIARLVGREYLRALRSSQPVGWTELATAAPRLGAVFPSDVLIQTLAAEVDLRAIEAAATADGGDARIAQRRADRLARLQETLLQTSQSFHDDGASAASRLLGALRAGDPSLYERVLWCEMSKRPELSQLWLWHAEALVALDRGSEVVEEYRLIGCFETSAAAMVGRSKHLARTSWDETEAQKILAELERLGLPAGDDQRAAMLASRLWLLEAMGRATEAWELLRASGIEPESSSELREAGVRAAMSSGEPQALKEAAALAFAPNGEPALASPLLSRVLKRTVEALPR